MNADAALEAIVQEALASIMSDYDFRVVESSDSYVRLDSHNTSILVHYDRHRSFEVGVEFSELVNGDLLRHIPFNLGEVYRQFGVPNADRTSFFQSTNVRAVRELLVSVGETLLKYCALFLAGDRGSFEAVSRRRPVEAAAYMRQVQLASIRAQADEAWRDKKYQEFVKLLGDFRDVLPESDRKKLDYAHRKLFGC